MRMSPMPGSPCWKSPWPEVVPLSVTTVKLMLAYWAQVWAALTIAFCQVAAEPNLALNLANRLLVTVPPVPYDITVPSGTKLRVIISGWGQAAPDVVYGTRR